MSEQDFSEAQLAAIRALAERPDLVKVLIEFGDNMKAARRVARWIAYLAGIAMFIAGFAYYVTGVTRNHG